MPDVKSSSVGISLSIAVFILLFAACAANSDKPATPRSAPVSVYIDNLRTVSMVVYVVDGAMRARLGEVSGLSQRIFPIPADMVSGRGTVQFVADPIGGSQQSFTDEISIRPGEEVRLTITNF